MFFFHRLVPAGLEARASSLLHEVVRRDLGEGRSRSFGKPWFESSCLRLSSSHLPQFFLGLVLFFVSTKSVSVFFYLLVFGSMKFGL